MGSSVKKKREKKKDFQVSPLKPLEKAIAPKLSHRRQS
jgi:hypothetical protein